MTKLFELQRTVKDVLTYGICANEYNLGQKYYRLSTKKPRIISVSGFSEKVDFSDKIKLKKRKLNIPHRGLALGYSNRQKWLRPG